MAARLFFIIAFLWAIRLAWLEEEEEEEEEEDKEAAPEEAMSYLKRAR